MSREEVDLDSAQWIKTLVIYPLSGVLAVTLTALLLSAAFPRVTTPDLDAAESREIDAALDYLSDAMDRLSDAERSIDSAKRKIVKAERVLDGLLEEEPDRPVRPDPPVDPPVDPPIDPPVDTPVDPPEMGDWSTLPFQAPPIPDYDIPTQRDCEWIVRNGVYESQMGLPSYQGSRAAYNASIEAGHPKPITIGVYDNAGMAAVGGKPHWGGMSEGDVTVKDGSGWSEGLSVEFVGLDDECEVELSWSNSYGYADYVGAFNIGLRGANDSFIIRGLQPAGDIIVDGCWFLARDGVSHESGAHLSEYESLVWRNYQQRGETPEDPEFVPQHHWMYLKACVADEPNEGTWVVGNTTAGGARTVIQWRPESGERSSDPGSSRPSGPVVIAENDFSSAGWNNENPDGGGAISMWGNPDYPTYVFWNKVTDSRFSSFTASPQGPDRDFYNAAGFPIGELYTYGNVFTNPRGDRDCVSITGVESVRFEGEDVYEGSPQYGELILDNPWGVDISNGLVNGGIQIYGQETLDYLMSPEIFIRTYDPNGGRNDAIPYDKSQLPGYLVEEDAEPR